MPNTHEYTPGVEEGWKDWIETALDADAHGRWKNAPNFQTIQEVSELLAPRFAKLFTAQEAVHQKSIEAVVERLEGEKKAMRGEINIDDHYKLGYNQALDDAITIIRDTLKS